MISSSYPVVASIRFISTSTSMNSGVYFLIVRTLLVEMGIGETFAYSIRLTARVVVDEIVSFRIATESFGRLLIVSFLMLR
jgi:hypothetical protein